MNESRSRNVHPSRRLSGDEQLRLTIEFACDDETLLIAAREAARGIADASVPNGETCKRAVRLAGDGAKLKEAEARERRVALPPGNEIVPNGRRRTKAPPRPGPRSGSQCRQRENTKSRRLSCRSRRRRSFPRPARSRQRLHRQVHPAVAADAGDAHDFARKYVEIDGTETLNPRVSRPTSPRALNSGLADPRTE